MKTLIGVSPRLKDSEVRVIRRKWKIDGVSQVMLAAEFKVTQSTISAIVLMKTHKHVKG